MKTTYGHLTYCSNIHPGEAWNAHFKELKDNLPYIRKELADGQPFALGLRLANDASIELSNPDRLQEFKDWLSEHDLYVFTMNGFPYGGFHDTVVKDQVHAPDWTTLDRTEYTKRLFSILAQLLPNGMDGGVSTSPLSYRFWWNDEGATDNAFQTATQNILQIADYLVEIKRETGKLMHLDIEPEPDGLLENSTEFVNWYRDHLLPMGIPYLQEKYGFTDSQAKDALLDHIRLCFDVCHVAVAYEEPKEVLERLNSEGIKVGKIQISSALKMDLKENKAEKIQSLRSFNEPVYLHQVVARASNGTFEKYPDLPEALADESAANADEWRIHFHVPLFVDSYGKLNSTQAEIVKTLDLLKEKPFTQHMEVETYTWGVLPDEIQKPIGQSIVRELQWVLERLG
ncbi:metabolite traffic protein EboE [Persicitalea jodogahamensis]|uniref:Sugar phosphate isomerase n=1 Tax=Persicitalea jodogahamensis TaxID=402147 RepID=A0A8J3D5I1_9BACT|nr:metabolite traffic protein EboE [Persicitalea jodogahamensis]GHB76940.1 sugar phosphate isomerase [Persicitalea jodogahamensis]